MDKQRIIATAIPFFSEKEYLLNIQTDNLLVFQSDEKDYSFAILIVLLFLGIAPAIVYYLMAPKSEVTISLAGEDDAVKLTAYGNTDRAKEEVEEFKKEL